MAYNGLESRNLILKECIEMGLSERQIIINLCKEINQLKSLRELSQCDKCREESAGKRHIKNTFNLLKAAGYSDNNNTEQ